MCGAVGGGRCDVHSHAETGRASYVRVLRRSTSGVWNSTLLDGGGGQLPEGSTAAQGRHETFQRRLAKYCISIHLLFV